MINNISVGLLVIGSFLIASGGFGTEWQVLTAGGATATLGLMVLAYKMNQEEKQITTIPKQIKQIPQTPLLPNEGATLNDPDTYTECCIPAMLRS